MPRLIGHLFLFMCPFFTIRRRIYRFSSVGYQPRSIYFFRCGATFPYSDHSLHLRVLHITPAFLPVVFLNPKAVHLLYLYCYYPLKYSTQCSKKLFIFAPIPFFCSGILTTSPVLILMYLICEESIFCIPSTFSA